jgi:hypothetical protein
MNKESVSVPGSSVEIKKWLCVIAGLILCFTGSLAVAANAADNSTKAVVETGTAAGVITPSRPGVLTGLGELALSRAYPDEAVWLSIGDDEQVLGLLLAERALPVQGALMILPEPGATAASGVAGGLAEQLADKGWAVLTVGLEAPSSQLQKLMERKPELPETSAEASADEAAPMKVDVKAEGDAGKPEAAYRQRVQKTVQAGLSALVGRGYETPALLAVGRASNYITTLPSDGTGVRAIIWVAPDFYPRDKASLADDVKTSGVPAVLELYDARFAGQNSGKRRAVALRQAGVNGYERQPVAIHQPPSVQDAPALANRIDAWLLSK